MARPKKNEILAEQVTFRCPVEVKRGVKILGMLDGYKTTSAMIVEILSGFVEENKSRIETFEKSLAERPIKKPQYAAQMSDEGDDSNAED